MILTINSYGVALKKQAECFLLIAEDRKERLSSKKIEQIIISNAVSISTDAIQLAMENNIDIVFLNQYGEPYGRVWKSKLGSVATIRREQLKLSEIGRGVDYSKEWINEKINAQVNHLRKLIYNRSDEKKRYIKGQIERIEELQNAFNKVAAENIEIVRNRLQAYEGNISKVYFKTLAYLIPAQYTFCGRSKNPAKDYFNCMLNYAYGILYAKVEKACIIAGLDPYIGIMHTDNYNKKSLVFDLIERYRGYVNEVVFKLFSTKQIKQGMFDEVKNGFYLNKEGKQLLIQVINEELARTIQYKGRRVEMGYTIQSDCHTLANQLLQEEED